jgi:hypothetical protein
MAIRIIILSIVLASSGCATIQDVYYCRSHKTRAFVGSYVTLNAPILNSDYTHGWRDGYYDFSTGRRCKPPVLPPHEYWKPCYQDYAGQRKIAEWYRGYQNGMIAAEKATGTSFHKIRPHGLEPQADLGMAGHEDVIGGEMVPTPAPTEVEPIPQPGESTLRSQSLFDVPPP